MSQEEKNKVVITQLIQALNAKDRSEFDECYAEEIEVYNRGRKRTFTHDEHWEVVESIFEVFPDYSEQILGIMAEGDRVYVYWASRGTHLGKGTSEREPTGIEAEWWGFSDYRLEAGKVVEARQIHDNYDLYTQLGLIEKPES